MKLSSFIATHREEILQAWKESASARFRPDEVSFAPVRDNLGELLDAIAQDLDSDEQADDLRTHQTRERAWTHVKAVAEKHGAGRAQEGMNVKQMVPELLALRASVTRLWRESLSSVSTRDLTDLIELDAAVDFALMHSVWKFMDQLSRSRVTFLSILGHDLRDPLFTVISGAKLMLEEGFDPKKMRDVASRIVRTGERMHQLVVDLLDFTRTRISGQMPIQRHKSDLGHTVRSLADEFSTSHPDRALNIDVSGDLHGSWDDTRMSQAIGNLLANAVHHGDEERPIDISTWADEREVAIAVHNEGPPIPKERRRQLFDPLNVARERDTTGRDTGHLGLGLYIAKAIVSGHRGQIEVDSTPEHGTTFTIRLPRENDGSGDETSSEREA
jgi:signal transduction histidine kinase